MAAVIEDGANGISDVITLSDRQRDLLSQILQDIRTTVQHLALPKVNPLSATDATAVDALKDLYYMLNVEDRLNALPARQHVFASKTVQTLLHPIIVALHSHPTAQQNQKRWSVPTYQALRTLCVLTSPIPDANQLLPRGCALDSYHSELRAFLAQNPGTLDAIVSLLQYYLERKAAKLEALSSAEACKLEDARIDNILSFFRNILAPPRAKPGDPILLTDAGIHLALVAALHKSDFYATLSILFDSAEDMATHTVTTVFLTVDIYAYTYRHSTPKSMFHTLRSYPYLNQSRSSAAPANDQSSEPRRIPPTKTISKTRSSQLREALLKERAALGGSRAVTAGARWSNRHSGGFTYLKASEAASRTANVAFPRKLNAKRIISAKAFVQSKLSFNPKRPFQEAVLVNSQFLCLSAGKGRFVLAKNTAAKAVVQIRKDLQDDGLKALVQMTIDFIESSFTNFVREVRQRIAETKEQTKRENPEILTRAQRSFLNIIGAVVGFQRERFGKIRKETLDENRPLGADIHQNHMKAVLTSDFKILKKDWKAVEAAIEVDTFKLAFRVLVESFEALKNTGKDEVNIGSIEVATFAVLEMMKMLQGMAAHVRSTEDEALEQGSEPDALTPRELALNTLEDLFSEEVFLNAPANLAKDFNAKLFSFKHLTNIVELGYSFTTILMDEQELHRLQVNKRKRHRKKKAVDKNVSKENPDEEEELQNKGKGIEPISENPKDDEGTTGTKQKPRKVKRITENADDDASEEEDKTEQNLNHPLSGQEVDPKSGPEDLSDDRVPSEKEGNTSEKSEPNSEESEPLTALSSGPVSDLGSKQTKTNAPLESEKPKTANLKVNTESDESGSPKPVVDDTRKPSSETTPNGKKPDECHDERNDVIEKEQSEPTESENQENATDNTQNEHDTPDDLRQMMMEEADDEMQDDENELKARTVQDMLRADVEAEAKAKAKEKAEKTKRMLLADVENEGKDIQPKLVSTIEEVFPEGIGRGSAGGPEVMDGGDNASEGEGSESSGDEPEVREMESMGIIRRFAHIKAIHSLLLPIRAAVCNTTSLTGESYPIPDGARPLLSPLVVAKSAHLVTSIWKVAKLRERGSLCGQFFTYGIMQLMEIMMNAPQHGTVKQFSVMEQLGVFARDVTKKFFEWLAINPGLTLDMVFGMDKGSCQMYTSFIRQKAIQEKHKNKEEDSGNDSDISQLAIASRPQNDLVDIGRSTRKSRRSPGSRRKRRAERRQRVERPKLDEDEDVDDLDNLKIGIMESEDEGKNDGGAVEDNGDELPNPEEHLLDMNDTDSSEEDAPKRVKRVRRRKRKIRENLEPLISDDDEEIMKSQKRSKGKKKGSKKRLKKTGEQEDRTTERKQFSSSDEYKSADNQFECSD